MDPQFIVTIIVGVLVGLYSKYQAYKNERTIKENRATQERSAIHTASLLTLELNSVREALRNTDAKAQITTAALSLTERLLDEAQENSSKWQDFSNSLTNQFNQFQSSAAYKESDLQNKLAALQNDLKIKDNSLRAELSNLKQDAGDLRKQVTGELDIAGLPNKRRKEDGEL